MCFFLVFNPFNLVTSRILHETSLEGVLNPKFETSGVLDQLIRGSNSNLIIKGTSLYQAKHLNVFWLQALKNEDLQHHLPAL